MPKYLNSGLGTLLPNPTPPSALLPGDEIYLFGTAPLQAGTSQKANDTNVVSETVTVGERSIAIQLAPRPGGGAAPGLMVQAVASANPGAAEIDIQDAATDADGAYLTPTGSAAYKLTTWTALNDGSGRYIAYAELQPEGARFITANIVANPNAVTFTVKAVYV